MKRSSFAGSPVRYSSLFSPGRKTACNGLAPRSAWIQPSAVLSSVRAQIPTLLVPSSELGSSSAMLQTFLSLKKIVSGKLHVIEIAVYIEKERIAAPTEEKTEIADLRHQGFLSD